MIIKKQPASIHTAFNPIVFEIESTSQEVEIVVAIGGKPFHMTKEVFGGSVVFDLSPIIRNHFSGEPTPLGRDYWEDPYLAVTYTVAIDGQEYNYTAVNAVVQVGESSSLVAKQGSFLTKFDRLKYYPGYKRIISILAFNGVNYFNFAEEAKKSVNTLTRVYNTYLQESSYIAISNDSTTDEYLTTNDDQVITDNLGNPIIIIRAGSGATEVRKYIDVMCIPDSPLYVRWVNSLGGIDYWMFSYRQLEADSISEREEYTPYTIGVDVNYLSKTLSLQGDKSIIAGASGINTNEYEAIKDVIYSPKVEYYNAELDKWIEVMVDDVELSRDTRSSTHSIEINFKLPQRQLQF